MTASNLIVDKVLADSAFCAKLVANPSETLGAMGVDATPEVVAALKGLDPETLQRLAGAFGKQQAAA
jgi:hypothetical protein